MPNNEPIESPEEWGRRQAAIAPPWSDAKWRRICGLLRINLEPEEDSAVAPGPAGLHDQAGTDAAERRRKQQT